MVSLTDEILTTIKDIDFDYQVRDVRPSYSIKKAQYPMVVVHEMDNRTTMALAGTERYSGLAYQIDVYAKDSMISGVPVSRQTIVDSLMESIDSEMNSTYGATRMSAVKMTDVNDDTVFRFSVRYKMNLDVVNGILYRKGD